MRRAVVYSFLAEFAAIASLVASFKIAAAAWGSAGFGEWAMTRRFLSFLLPLVVCGLDIAIPRYVAFATRGKSEHAAASYMGAALLFTLTSLVVVSLLLFALRRQVAELVFGGAEYEHLVLPVWTLMTGYSLYILCYGFLRGTMRIMEANFAHVLTFGVLPLAALAIFPQAPRSALLGLGVFAMVMAAACLAYVQLHGKFAASGALGAARTLIAYGSKRMYAALGLMGLALLPATIAAHEGGLEQAGFVVFGLTLVGMAASAATPLGVTMLPLASALVAEGRVETLRTPLRRLEQLMFAASLAGIAVIWASAPFVARLFFGEDWHEPALMLRIAALGAGPYAYFACMRNFIDAYTEEGVNTRNVFVALAAFAAIVIGVRVASDFDVARIAAGAYVACAILLAALTWRAVHSMLAAKPA